MTEGVIFRSEPVGPFTVRELPMRLYLQVLKEWPEAGIERAAAYLAHAVSNGTGEPIGREAVMDLPPALFNQLMDTYMKVSARYDQPAEGSAEVIAQGNA